MKKSEPKNGDEITFYKRNEFLIYRTWKCLPTFLKGVGRERDSIRERMGIEDERHIELLKIRTQKEFAEKYDLCMDTLTDWNAFINKTYDPIEETREWTRDLTKNVVNATYNSALQRDPKANADRKLFLQLQGWVEKSEQTVNTVNITELIKQKLDNARKRKSD